MLTINTNVASLNSQRNLTGSQSALATSLQRLSSGLRINSAKDDAAGLAISERMSGQIRGMDQARRNANDGISLAQTAEGALGQMTNALQRIRELAVQSANATNSGADRDAIQEEVTALRSEIDRISTTTEFNGLKLLDGSFTSQTFQVGANSGQNINVTVDSARAASIGSYAKASSDTSVSAGFTAGGANAASATVVAGSANYTGVSASSFAAGGVQLNGVNVAASSSYAVSGDTSRGGDSAYAKAAAINATNVPNVTASATNEQTFAARAGGTFVDFTQADNETYDYTLTINGTDVLQKSTATTDITLDDAISAINSFKDDTGVVASKDSSGNLKLTAADGRNIEVGESFTSAGGAVAGQASIAGTVFSDVGVAAAVGTATTSQTYRGAVTLQSTDDITINAGQADIGFTATLIAVDTSKNIENIDVSTVSKASDAILSVDAALASINANRASLGAVQSRFETTISNLMTSSENLTASRSRIQDADFASETAKLSRNQVLQQAGTAMLAQANQLPQNVLSLLR